MEKGISIANKALTLKEKNVVTIKDMMKKQQCELAKALPKNLIDPARFARIAITTLQNSPELQECTPISFLSCVTQCAQLGLVPDGLLGQAYLIPRGRQVTFLIGYRGLISLALRSGKIKSISAHPVYENEIFDVTYGIEESLTHKPSAPSGRGPLKGAYATATMADGTVKFEWLWAEEIEHIKREAVKSRNVWSKWPDEMIRKTAVRRLAKYLPLYSSEFEEAVSHDIARENGTEQPANNQQEGDIDFILTDEVEQAEIVEEKPQNYSEALNDLLTQQNVAPATLSAYTVKALGKMVALEELDSDQAKKVYEYIKEVKK